MRIIIAGGGISGLSLAYYLAGREGMDIVLLESERRSGGKIWSDRVEGYLCESGVNGFLDSKPDTLDLAAKLSIKPLRSFDESRIRYIYSDGRLNSLPDSPPAFLKSSLISIPGKLRLLLEPVIPKTSKPDESLADFGRRRLGREAMLKLIDPMSSGIFAGDPEALSLPSCFPRIHELEQKYGSLVRAMISLMRERKKNVSAAPAGKLTSFAGGMQDMVDALMAALGPIVRTGAKVQGVEKTSGGYSVHLADGTRMEADAVVLATPAHQTSQIIKGLDTAVSKTLEEIPYPSLSVVCTGFKASDLNISVKAFGFLVPSREGRKVLGTLYDSSVFPQRAPEGHVLLRTMVGGARASATADLDDRKLLNLVMDEVRRITGLGANPVFTRIYRHPRAIPQYNLGHAQRVEAAEGLQSRLKGLYITGNAYKGVSVNDCITNSLKLSNKVIEEMA